MERLAAIEISYRTAAMSIRERFVMDAAARQRHAATLRDRFGECVIIKTCGRVEVYVANAAEASELVTAFAGLLGLAVDDVSPYVKTYRANEVVAHLLRVASGLESPILGEDHILGQVRDAFLSASEHTTCGANLSAIFRAAIHTGRRVRHQTGINRVAGSYAEQAVDYVRRTGVAKSSRVLILGTGTLGVQVATALRAAGYEDLGIVGRHESRRELVASAVGATPIAWDARAGAARQAHVVLACTSSPTPILTHAMLRNASASRLLIDLGMPRNIESTIAEIPGITLATLDDVLVRGDASVELVRQAEEIIDVEQRRVARWFAARRNVEAIRHLRAWAEQPVAQRRDARRRAAHVAIMQLQANSKEAAA